VVWQN